MTIKSVTVYMTNLFTKVIGKILPIASFCSSIVHPPSLYIP